MIYLVPEIGLTPLLLDKVGARFPEGAVVLHSGLSARERYAGWEALRDGRCRFVVGTRSAVFAPVRALGLIVVDEEQDGSYKQGEMPRYNARDLSVVRARAERVAALVSQPGRPASRPPLCRCVLFEWRPGSVPPAGWNILPEFPQQGLEHAG